MDIPQIITDVCQALIPLAVAYFVRLRKDLDAAHTKLRDLSKAVKDIEDDLEDFLDDRD